MYRQEYWMSNTVSLTKNRRDVRQIGWSQDLQHNRFAKRLLSHRINQRITGEIGFRCSDGEVAV